MSATPDIGLGTQVTFASGFFARILSATRSGIKREAVDITNMSSAQGWMEFIASRLKDPGGLDVELLFDQDATPPIGSAAETITITFPAPANKTNGATIVCTGFMTEEEIAIPVDDKMTQTVKIKFTGIPVITPSS